MMEERPRSDDDDGLPEDGSVDPKEGESGSPSRAGSGDTRRSGGGSGDTR